MFTVGNAMKTITIYALIYSLVSSILPVSFLDATSLNDINVKWSCEACGDPRNNPYIFDMVRRAMYSESREVYLNFDHSWIDDALLYNKHNVIVKIINRGLLCDYQVPDFNTNGFSSSHNVKETYIIAISLPSGIDHLLQLHNRRDHGDPKRLSMLPYREALKIDKFLTLNPCWIPLHDPLVRRYTENYTIAADVSDNSQLPTCSNHPELATMQVPSLYLLSRSQLNIVYKFTAIFAKLPQMHFKSTCMLYTYITQRQFPQRCPSLKDNGTAVWVGLLGNIGWTHTHNFLVDGFRGALIMDRLYIVPSAEKFYSQEVTIDVTIGGRVIPITNTWRWADAFACDNYTLALNPWACHFIALSNCTDLAYRSDISSIYPQITTVNWGHKGQFHSLLTELRDNATLASYEAITTFENWLHLRLSSFVQRPNIQTRWAMRTSIANVKHVHQHLGKQKLLAVRPSHAKHVHPSSKSKHHSGHQHLQEVAETHSENDEAVDHRMKGAASMLSPCVGIHIRHGDSNLDLRGNARVDRSSRHFVLLAQNLSRHLGINNFYMATDNMTAVYEAAVLYTQSHWFAQLRPLPAYTGGAYANFHYQDTKKNDIADILADLVVMSRCVGMVAAFDSGFANLLHQYQCSRNKVGQCPPFFNRGQLGELNDTHTSD